MHTHIHSILSLQLFNECTYRLAHPLYLKQARLKFPAPTAAGSICRDFPFCQQILRGGKVWAQENLWHFSEWKKNSVLFLNTYSRFNFYSSPALSKFIASKLIDIAIMNSKNKIGRSGKKSVNSCFDTIRETLPTLPVCWIVRVSALLATKTRRISQVTVVINIIKRHSSSTAFLKVVPEVPKSQCLWR